MFEPCSPHTHDVRTTAARGAERQRLALAGELRRAVHRPRRRSGPTRGTGGRACRRRRSRSTRGRGGRRRGRTPRRASAPTAALARERPLGIALARVDGGPRRAVDDGVGPHRRDRAEHGVAVGDVERGVVGARPPRRPPPSAAATTSWPSCPPAPVTSSRITAPQRAYFASVAAFSGSHHAALARYQLDRRGEPVAEVVLRSPAELGAQLVESIA